MYAGASQKPLTQRASPERMAYKWLARPLPGFLLLWLERLSKNHDAAKLNAGHQLGVHHKPERAASFSPFFALAEHQGFPGSVSYPALFGRGGANHNQRVISISQVLIDFVGKVVIDEFFVEPIV